MTERDTQDPKMSDPKIRLFGKTIELPESGGAAGEDGSNLESSGDDGGLNGDAEEQESRESLSSGKQDRAEDEERCDPIASEELNDSSDSCPMTEDPNAPSETEGGSEKTMIKNEDDQNETSNSQDKALKKPDKILPCPRCNSMDTKFCYFNNYNVNQPRHFCKNCQRYWTAGGTMRNVPVGAGRRKNKNPIPQFRHMTVPEALQSARALNTNGTVLTFGSDSPLCESMASVLNIVDKTNSRNGFHGPEDVEISVSDRSKESGDDSSTRSSTTASSSKDELGKRNGFPEMMPNGYPFPQQVPCYAGGPWPYPWNPMQWNPTVSPPNFPMPFYATPPRPYWACAVPPGAWNVPWVMQRPPTAPQNHTAPTSVPNSPTLGKHSRDENIPKPANTEEGTPKESNLEKNLWFPKTLRIDDPGEAAKSSIWATLGIKNERAGAGPGAGSGGGIFKPFQTPSKGDEKSHILETSTVLQANPAAFSRSLNFHENS